MTDSEADDESDENDKDEDGSEDNTETSSEEVSVDSGAESGPGLTHSSDETEKKLVNGKQKSKATTNKQQKQKQPKQREAESSVDVLADKIKEASVNIRPVEQKGKTSSSTLINIKI